MMGMTSRVYPKLYCINSRASIYLAYIVNSLFGENDT